MNAKQTKLIKNIYKIITWLTGYSIIGFALYIFNGNYNIELIYNIGRAIAYAAVFFFAITILPGMLKRFGIKSKFFVTRLTAFKRENGDLMFVLAFLHYTLIKLFPAIESGNIPPVFLFFEFFGMAALMASSALFFTSNDFSIKFLKKNWKRLHYLVYIIVWLIFFHVAFAKINFGTFVVGSLAFMETLSLIYYYSRKLFKK